MKKRQSFLKSLFVLFVLGLTTASFASNSGETFKKKLSFVELNLQSEKLPKVVVQNIQGTFYENLSAYNISPEMLANEFHTIFDLDSSEHEFVQLRDYQDNIGMHHQTYQHNYKGVPVEGELIMVHSKNGVVKSINGQVTQIADLDISGLLSDEKVIGIIQSQEKISRDDMATAKIETILYKKIEDDKLQHHAVKKVFLGVKNFYVDANSGKVLFVESKIYHIDTPGTGNTYYRGNQPVTVDSYNGQYRLKDNERKIHVLDASNIINLNPLTGVLTGSGEEYMNSSANYTSSETEAPVEILWGLSKTYDYYMDVHQRDSYDGNGGSITGYFNFDESAIAGAGGNAGAFAVQTQNPYMVYGTGLQGILDIVVGLDVAGHEYSHVVISRNGNGGLVYQGESGALNESFADMFGTAIEFYTNLNPNWRVGENIFLPQPGHMRDMSNPNDAPPILGGSQPDTYEGQNWADPAGSVDNGGVHINSGVGNYWFYLLSEGGSGTNDVGNAYNVTGQTIQKAEQIAYRALTNYINETATYLDARNATIQAAEDLYGENSAEVAAVENAWWAVNVGPAPTSVSQNTFKNNILVYPNPVTDNQLNIDVQSGIENDLQVAVFDILGKQVLGQSDLNQGSNTIDVSSLEAGVYLLKFVSDNSYYTHKIVIAN